MFANYVRRNADADKMEKGEIEGEADECRSGGKSSCFKSGLPDLSH